MNRSAASVAAFTAAAALFFAASPFLALATGPAPNQTTVAKAAPKAADGTDPFLWLEDKDGQKAMDWVRSENAKTLPVLEGDSHYASLYNDALKIDNNKDRIAYPSSLHGAMYNFWQDSAHVRGVWRKTTDASYATASPAWTTVIDVDALAKAEKANWVFEGADCFYPVERRCMVSLSDGGEDATTAREFDLDTKSFVKGGFVLPHGKQNASWFDDNTLLVAREWAPGEMTTSGYPYVVKMLKRGQPLSAAKELFRGKKSDVSASPYLVQDAQGHKIAMINRGITFWTSETYIVTGNGLKRLAIPEKSSVGGLVDGHLLVNLSQDWTINGKTIPQGSLVSMPLAATLADPAHLKPSIVYQPGVRESLGGQSVTAHGLMLVIYQNVQAHAFYYTPKPDGTWTRRQLALPANSTIGVEDVNLHTGKMFMTVTSFLTPTTLWSVDTAALSAKVVRATPALFDASKDVVEQHEATSKDGTKIPYFIVHPKGMHYDGSNPTVLYAYGGFAGSMTPSYSSILGKLWLERGGVYVLANIRGGGEFGPAWHEAGLTTHRQRIYDDFYAVGKDVIARNVTSPRRLGIMGGSNGGLLMGVEFTQHPEMWNAVDIQVPLLDMLRFEKIQAGASWVGEYGSVSNPEQRAFLASISPYNNLREGTAYPEPLIWTTTKDDRVGPQHARKFAAMLNAMQVPYLFYEVTEGGHGSGANLNERAHTSALEWTYFTKKLME